MFSISNLSCSRGDKRLFSGVSFALQPGEWLHLEGDNGVGKTSLLRLACGLSALEQGQIQWQGQPVSSNIDEFRANLAYLGHQLALKEDLTPLENLRADTAIAGRALSLADAKAALAQLGLKGREHLPVRVLSQGQKRRTALARLLVSSAPLWILDEPFVALDAAAQKVLSEVINGHLNRQGMVLFTSHQMVTLAGQGRSYRLKA
ncbi:cytochrome c biogenesis heme-transporting ATPase CcmA [Limnohabitans sp. Rim11]|uniref:cytochrome c biogenesis heme-transporting ATPase CcmA n=1 Tax=Limnohabitans sp. Rim11 TaxID=1100719 RepID=UPI000AF6A507|nr:cytochrome c biogenesis heme-transporting ATPase CcmA [Limnohabitans sp. Rim11]